MGLGLWEASGTYSGKIYATYCPKRCHILLSPVSLEEIKQGWRYALFIVNPFFFRMDIDLYEIPYVVTLYA